MINSSLSERLTGYLLFVTGYREKNYYLYSIKPVTDCELSSCNRLHQIQTDYEPYHTSTELGIYFLGGARMVL